MNVYHHKKKCLVTDAIAKILFTEIHYGFIQSDNSSYGKINVSFVHLKLFNLIISQSRKKRLNP